MSDLFRDLLSIGKKIIEASEAIQAEIDKHSPIEPSTAKSAPASTSASDAATTSSGGSEWNYSLLYLQHLKDGCPDPLKLLTVEDAERLIGCVIAKPSTMEEEEYIGRHYGCADDRSMYVALTVSATMPWDFIVEEVNSQPAPHAVGDEALVAGDHLYVRQGGSFFWLYGRGVDQPTIYRIAEHVAANLATGNYHQML